MDAFVMPRRAAVALALGLVWIVLLGGLLIHDANDVSLTAHLILALTGDLS